MKHLAVQLNDDNDHMVVEQTTITPTMASQWLEHNTLNRPIRKTHVKWLAGQMRRGEWGLNGETIKISASDDILDGQHRLLACIDSATAFSTLVIYGVEKDDFKTIDTGINRTGSDTLALHFTEEPRHICHMVATAISWNNRIEQGVLTTPNYKLTNNYILASALARDELWAAAHFLSPHSKRALISISACLAALCIFEKRNIELGRKYIIDVLTGEQITHVEVPYMVREIFIADERRVKKMSIYHRVAILIKGWNLLRKNKVATKNNLRINFNEKGPEVL